MADAPVPAVSREAILEVASELFRKKGFRQTRLEDIARHFGVTRAALYYYFTNKLEILGTIHLDASQGLMVRVNEVLDSDAPPEVRLRKLLAHHVEYVAAHSTVMKVFYEEEHSLPEDYVRAVVELRQGYHRRLAALYREGVGAGVFRAVDPDLAAHVLLGSCTSVYQWYRSEFGADPASLGPAVADFLAEGYRAGRAKGAGSGRVR